MEPPLTNTLTHAERGSFTGNLWLNWTLIEGRFTGGAAVEFRGSEPAGVAWRPASRSCYTETPTHAAGAFQTKYNSGVSYLLICSAQPHTHVHTLQRNRHSHPYCTGTQVMQEARRKFICIICLCAACLSCLYVSLCLPLDVRCCGFLYSLIHVGVFLFVLFFAGIDEWGNAWVFIPITDCGILPRCHCTLYSHCQWWKDKITKKEQY